MELNQVPYMCPKCNANEANFKSLEELEFHLVEHHLHNIPPTTQSQTANGQRLLGINERIDDLNRNFRELSIEQKELKEMMKKLERLSGNDQKIVNMLVDKLNEKESAVLSKATYVF